MKKQLLSMGIALFAAGSLMAQSIPNNGFENWNANAWMDPVGYQTSNDNNGFYGAPASVARVSPGYHGSYAVQASAQVVGVDTSAGFFIDGNPNGGSVTGGIPYTQKPTGIRLYYKYKTTQPDTALVLVFFKKAGALIGEYEGQIIPQASSFTLVSLAFTPALSVAPDTIVFGAVTSSNVFTNGGGRAGSVLTIDSVTFTGVTSQPNLLNGDFETWNADTSLTPQYWVANSFPSTQRTTDAAAGKYALELVTTGPGANQNSTQAGNADDGKLFALANGNDSIGGGYPYSQLIDTLVLSYKYAPADTADRASVTLQFQTAGVVNNYVGSTLKASASYITVEIPFNLGSTTPDTTSVFLSSTYYSGSGNIPNSYAGAVFKVDNIYFKSQASTVGIAPVTTNANIKVYPNPATTVFNVDMNNSTDKLQSITVYDMAGKAVAYKNYIFMSSNSGVETIDVTGYSAGVYNVVIRTDKGVKYEKVTKI